MSKTRDVKESTVDREVGNIVKHSGGQITVDKARELVRKEAEKINHQRRK